MTAGEEDHPPPLPQHRRPLSEPPDPGGGGGVSGYPVGAGPLDDPSLPDHVINDKHAAEPDGYYSDGADGRQAGPWFDGRAARPAVPPNAPMPGGDHVPSVNTTGQVPRINEYDAAMGGLRMPGTDTTQQHPSSMPMNQVPASAATGQTPAVGAPAGRGSRGAGGWAGQRSSSPFDVMRSGPLPLVAAALALVVAAGLIGWLFRGTGSGQEITIGDGAVAGQDTDAPDGDEAVAELPPLSPATLPAANEDGLVGLELALIDPYTGTGSTGSAELYLNALTGQVCHVFDAAALDGRYVAYIHEGEFPKAGPIVVELGEVSNSVPQCVNASPIDLTRALADSDAFYIAAHAGEREIVLRAQLSSANIVFDNRDADLVASQEAASADADDGESDGLFDSTDDGAYLVVESGRVSFEGMVPDEQTADQLRAAFIALSGMGVDVADNLTVQAGAPAPSGKVIVADALLFGSGQDQISGDPAVLSTLADLMTVNPTWTMTITGHTDDVGPYSLNIELSLRRANNIRDRLAELGVPPERIRVQGAGPEQPIDDNSTDEGRAKNRRIEISIDS